LRLCLVDTGVFLCLAFEDPGYKQEILKLKPRVRSVGREIAKKAAEYRSTVQTPDGKWLALTNSGFSIRWIRISLRLNALKLKCLKWKYQDK